MRAPAGADIAAGEVLLAVENVSLVVRRREGDHATSRSTSARARSAPSSARTAPARPRCSTSSTASITPQQGRITFKGETRAQDAPATRRRRGGIARTFQNVALFRGMTALDNIMAGRTLKMHRGLLLAAAALRPGDGGGSRASPPRRGDHRVPARSRISARFRSAGCPTACRSASSSAARSRWSRICCCSTSRWPA